MTAKSCLIVILHMLFFSTLSAQYISIPDTLVTWEEGHMSGGDCQGYIYYHDKLYTYGPPVYAYGHKYTYVKRYREEKSVRLGELAIITTQLLTIQHLRVISEVIQRGNTFGG